MPIWISANGEAGAREDPMDTRIRSITVRKVLPKHTCHEFGCERLCRDGQDYCAEHRKRHGKPRG